MKKLTAKDIPSTTGRGGWTDTVKHGAYSVRVRVQTDDCMGEPWKEHDGHGPVSDWRAKDSKRPGERIMATDRGQCLFYDFAAAVQIAKRDGWGAEGGYHLKGGARAAHAAAHDFEILRRWCAGEWQWLVIGVEVSHRGVVLDTDYCGGIESYTDYWREHAADVANSLIAAHREETRERRYWEARDVATVAA